MSNTRLALGGTLGRRTLPFKLALVRGRTQPRCCVMRPIVAYQGEPGAFSEGAASRFIEGEIDLLPCETFTEAVAAVERGAANFAAIPIHNITAGPVHAALNALQNSSAIEQIDEKQIHIHLALMAVPGALLDGIREAHSHQMALGQCGVFLAAHPSIVPVEANDTAGAARLVAAWNDPRRAAIAAVWAASRHGLVVLAEGLEDRANNLTTFVLIARLK